MPRYVSKGGMIKCHAYQFSDNVMCDVTNLTMQNPDSVKVVSYSFEPPTISLLLVGSEDKLVVPLDYYLVFYDDGEVSVVSPEAFSAHYELANQYLKG